MSAVLNSVIKSLSNTSPADMPSMVGRLDQKISDDFGPLNFVSPIEESYRGAAARNIAEALGGERADYTRAKKLMSAGDFLPVVGDAQAGVDMVDAANRGDYLEAGVNSLGLLPFVGGMASKTGRELLNYLRVPEVDRDTTLLQRVGDVDSVNNMKVDYEAVDPFVDLDMPSAEQLLNRPYVSTMADTSRGRGERVVSVNDVPINATMLGGQDNMTRAESLKNMELWSSDTGPAQGILNAANEASDLPGARGNPIFMPYGMAGASPDFANFSSSVSLPYAQSVLPKAAKAELDKRIRAGSGKIAGVSDWPGIDSPDMPMWMRQAGGKRKDVLKAVDEFRNEGALNASQTRAIVTDPSQLNPKVGALINVGELDVSRGVFSSTHDSYPGAVGGSPIGRFGFGFNVLDAKPLNRKGLNFVELMKRNGHNLQANKLPSPVGKAMQGGGLIGVLDQEIIDDMISKGIVKP